MADEIDVGGSCVSRGSQYGNQRTIITTPSYLPANLRGKLTRVLIYPNHIFECKYWVGVFYRLDGNTFKCRSAQYIGWVSYPCRTYYLAPHLTIMKGDIMGFYSPDPLAKIDRSPGTSSFFWADGNHCVNGDEATYTDAPQGGVFSLRGRGDYVPHGHSSLPARPLPTPVLEVRVHAG